MEEVLLSKFFPIVSVTITINFAFIAIEYIKGAFDQLLNGITKVDERVERLFRELNAAIEGKKKTVNELSPIPLGNGDTSGNLKSLKIKFSKFEKTLLDIDEKSKIKDNIKTSCYVKYTPFFNLNLCVFNLLWLMFGVIESIVPSWAVSLSLVWCCFSLLFCIGFVVLFSFKEKWFKDKIHINRTFCGYLILLIISCFSTYFFGDSDFFKQKEIGKKVFLFCMSLFPYIYMGVLVYMINSRAKSVGELIKLEKSDKSLEIVKQYFNIEDEYNELMVIYKAAEGKNSIAPDELTLDFEVHK